jgi:hypothetical protein
MKYISIFLLALALSASPTNVKAQDLIGVRLGWFSGVTYQHYMESNTSLEFIGQFTRGGYNFTGLYEIHNPIPNADGLNFYYGAGGHVGFYREKRYDLYRNRYNGSGSVIGLDGIIGLEYFFKPIPLQLSLDYKPALNFGGGDIWPFNDLALAVRVAF